MLPTGAGAVWSDPPTRGAPPRPADLSEHRGSDRQAAGEDHDINATKQPQAGELKIRVHVALTAASTPSRVSAVISTL